MIALLAAASLVATDAPPFVARPTPCLAGMLHTSGQPALLFRPQDQPAARYRKLGELPDARREYAVLRTVAGCMVPAPIGYHPRPAGR